MGKEGNNFKMAHKNVMCGLSELDYNPPKIIQNQVDHAYTIDLSPSNTLIAGNNINFRIESSDDFIDLANTELSIELQLTKADGEKIADDTHKIAPVNNILHSFWSQVQIKLKDSTISHPCPNYAYRAYLEHLELFQCRQDHLDEEPRLDI